MLDYPCEVKIPKRVYQLEFLRWGFVISYALIAALTTSILITVTNNHSQWTANLVLDAVLLIIFMVYAKNAHVHEVNNVDFPLGFPIYKF